MRTRAALLVLVTVALLASCAVTQTSDDEVILTPAQRETCAAEGGCVMFTRKALQSLIEQVTQAARRGGA